jgi:hypothetical protein
MSLGRSLLQRCGLTGNGADVGECANHRHHEQFVRCRIEDGAKDCLLLPAARQSAVDYICYAGVDVQHDRIADLAMESEVDDWRHGKDSSDSEKVRYCVDVFLFCDGFQPISEPNFRSRWS